MRLLVDVLLLMVISKGLERREERGWRRERRGKESGRTEESREVGKGREEGEGGGGREEEVGGGRRWEGGGGRLEERELHIIPIPNTGREMTSSTDTKSSG